LVRRAEANPTNKGRQQARLFGLFGRRWLHRAKLVDEAIDYGAQFVDEQIVVDVNDRIQRAI
jgi:hypothetical protein